MAPIPQEVTALAILGLLLIGAKLGEELFRRLGLIPFVGAILVGILVGPGVLALVPSPTPGGDPTISLFVTLGINFLLFISGAQEFEATRLRTMLRNRRTLLVSLVEFVVRFVGITALAYLLFQDLLPAVVVGVVAGMSSAGPLSRLLTDTGLARTHEGTAIFSQVVIMNILPVPGSISFPQNEQDRWTGMRSPHAQLARFARGLAQHEHVAELDAPLHVPRDDAALVTPVQDAHLDLGRLARHPRAADDLDHFCGDAVLIGHRCLSGSTVTSSSRGASRRGRR